MSFRIEEKLYLRPENLIDFKKYIYNNSAEKLYKARKIKSLCSKQSEDDKTNVNEYLSRTLVVIIPAINDNVPIDITIYGLTSSENLSCAKLPVPTIVEIIITGIVNQAFLR